MLTAFAFATAAVIWRKDPMDARDSRLGTIGDSKKGAAMELLRVHPENSQHFTNESGKAIYLTGSHTWTNFQNISDHSQDTFDYPDYLRLLASNNHNFMRMWMGEQAAMFKTGYAPVSKEASIARSL